MTRINTIGVEYLTDKHLMAEYHELPRVFTSVKKLSDSHEHPENLKIPEQYCLGEGHVRFFYDKVGWLEERFKKLKDELQARGFRISIDRYTEILRDAGDIHPRWKKIWIPVPEDYYLNMARLVKRVGIKRVGDELEGYG